MFPFRNPFRKDNQQDGPSLPSGYRAYAVGDVHGRLDLLNDLLARIEADIDGRGPAQNVVIFLGDLIDRGPSSAQVVERLRTYRGRDVRTVFISGNHEEVMLRLLRGEPDLLRDWLKFGGAECLQSYGLDVRALKAMEPSRALEAVRSKVPQSHQAFLRRFVETFRIGGYLFVHAGIRPGVPLSDQRQADLRWIREPFLNCNDDHGFVVVHGHTIVEDVEIRANRIGLDTGAYRSGVLSAIGLEGEERWFLQSSAAAVPSPEATNAPVAIAEVD